MNRQEIWMSVRDYVGLYEVSNWGRVRSYYTGKVLKPCKTNGYLNVCLCKDGKKGMFLVHRLVYEAFCGPIPKGMVTDHCDGCRANNCLENLRVCTQKENVNNPNTKPRLIEAMRNKSPEWRKANNKPIVQIDKVTGETIKRWASMSDAERELGINQSSISLCCTGKLKSAGGYRWRFAS